MATPPVIQVIQKKDLNTTQFVYNSTTKQFTIAPVSADAGNVLAAGSDGLAKLTAAGIQNNQITYTMGLDSSTPPNILLYKTVGGTTTTVNTIATSSIEANVTGGSYSSGTLTLTEQGGGSVNINIGSFLTQVATANSNTITHSGVGTSASPLTASVTIDSTVNGQLLTMSSNGLSVTPSNVLALLNANITHTLSVDTTNGYLKSIVNGVSAQLNLAQLQDSTGATIGYALTGT